MLLDPFIEIQRLRRRVDRLEAAVVALCEQDGEVTYERDNDDNA